MISMSQMIWRTYLKYGKKGPVLKKKDNNRRNIYHQKNQKLKRKKTERYIFLKKYFENEYFVKEKGIKSIAKENNLTYTEMRCFLNFLEIPLREGRNVVTDRLKQFRRNKALEEHQKGVGWFDPDIRRKIESTNKRGVQGYFLNESTKKLVWLRSTYEYIFAKWLNKTKQNWDVEVTYYKLGDNIYRPDFFIYDEKFDILEKIVEIKGYWDNNSNKALRLNEELSGVDVSIIINIEKFIEHGSTYEKELTEWKEKRIARNG